MKSKKRCTARERLMETEQTKHDKVTKKDQDKLLSFIKEEGIF